VVLLVLRMHTQQASNAQSLCYTGSIRSSSPKWSLGSAGSSLMLLLLLLLLLTH
jgi:hypothetical protein